MYTGVGEVLPENVYPCEIPMWRTSGQLVAHCLNTLPSVALKLAKMLPLLSEHMCTAVNGSSSPPAHHVILSA